ncbi:MAG: hypothetical protein SCH71_11475 [Desulfobulbaceae bacterium]|nr:hypothetical protein [Desulfobulbaceae bacterium]
MHTRYKRFLFFITLALMLQVSSLCLAAADYVTITLPENVIRKSIENTLPISLNPDEGVLEGNLVLDAIDRFELGQNSAVIHGLILGKNMVLTTRIGDQNFNFKLGEMRLPLTCNFTFRFDRQEKNLYITPHLKDSLQGASPEDAGKVLPLLALLDNREFPISFESMKRFQTRIGRQYLTVEMEPVDIQILPGELVLKMAPQVSKMN